MATTMWARATRAGRLQAKQELEFLNPLPVGSRGRSSARVVEWTSTAAAITTEG
jgi:hypothetical protein